MLHLASIFKRYLLSLVVALQFYMSVHFSQHLGWLKGEVLGLNSKFLSADQKQNKFEVFQPIAYQDKMSV